MLHPPSVTCMLEW